MPPLHYPQTTFTNDHNDLNSCLQAFLYTKRGRRLATEQLKANLRFKAALSLKAMNAVARVRFAEAFGREIRLRLARQNIKEVFFVTVIVREHAVRLNEAAAFDITACKKATRSLLDGFDFIGMVEAAYYYRASFVPGPQSPFVGWHSHALVWGAIPKELAKRRRAFNQNHQAFVPGACAAHYKRITASRATSYARYMSKSLLKEYTAYPLMRKVPDPESGELIKKPTGKWRNRNRPIRATNLARAARAMAQRTLIQLSFAGGTEKVLRRDLLRATCQKLCADGEARASRRSKLLFGLDISRKLSSRTETPSGH